MRDPSEMPIGHHHERPRRPSRIDAAAQGDVLGPPDGSHALVRFQTRSEMLLALVQTTL
jgi:hypothetical protein